MICNSVLWSRCQAQIRVIGYPYPLYPRLPGSRSRVGIHLGEYTLVIHRDGQNHEGEYRLSLVKLPEDGCLSIDPDDPDGNLIKSNCILTGIFLYFYGLPAALHIELPLSAQSTQGDLTARFAARNDNARFFLALSLLSLLDKFLNRFFNGLRKFIHGLFEGSGFKGKLKRY